VHPPAAALDRRAVPGVRPRAPAQPVAGLEEEDDQPTAGELASGGRTGEPAPDDDYVLHGSRILPREISSL
jgi:hypothetical protein